MIFEISSSVRYTVFTKPQSHLVLDTIISTTFPRLISLESITHSVQIPEHVAQNNRTECSLMLWLVLQLLKRLFGCFEKIHRAWNWKHAGMREIMTGRSSKEKESVHLLLHRMKLILRRRKRSVFFVNGVDSLRSCSYGFSSWYTFVISSVCRTAGLAYVRKNGSPSTRQYSYRVPSLLTIPAMMMMMMMMMRWAR